MIVKLNLKCKFVVICTKGYATGTCVENNLYVAIEFSNIFIFFILEIRCIIDFATMTDIFRYPATLDTKW